MLTEDQTRDSEDAQVFHTDARQFVLCSRLAPSARALFCALSVFATPDSIFGLFEYISRRTVKDDQSRAGLPQKQVCLCCVRAWSSHASFAKFAFCVFGALTSPGSILGVLNDNRG